MDPAQKQEFEDRLKQREEERSKALEMREQEKNKDKIDEEDADVILQKLNGSV